MNRILSLLTTGGSSALRNRPYNCIRTLACQDRKTVNVAAQATPGWIIPSRLYSSDTFSQLSSKVIKQKRSAQKKYTEILEVKGKVISESTAKVQKLKGKEFGMINQEREVDLKLLKKFRRSRSRLAQYQKEQKTARQSEAKAMLSRQYSASTTIDVVGNVEAASDANLLLFDKAASEEGMEEEDVEEAQQSSRKSKAKKKKQAMQEENDALARVKHDELKTLARDAALAENLRSYYTMCIHAGGLSTAFDSLQFHRARHKLMKNKPGIRDVRIYNALLNGYADKGNLKMTKEILKMLHDDKILLNVDSYAAVLRCFGKVGNIQPFRSFLENLLESYEKEGHALENLLSSARSSEMRKTILHVLQQVRPNYTPHITPPNMEYSCKLLEPLNDCTFYGNKSVASDLLTADDIQSLSEEQMKIEMDGFVRVKSIYTKYDNDQKVLNMRELLLKTEAKWHDCLLNKLKTLVAELENRCRNGRLRKNMNIYPYIAALPPEELCALLLQEVRKLAEGSESYSESTYVLYRLLGELVYQRFLVKYKTQEGLNQKIAHLYDAYNKWFINSELEPLQNSRQKFQALIEANPEGPSVDVVFEPWPTDTVRAIGKFLYTVLLKNFNLEPELLYEIDGTIEVEPVPAFYTVFGRRNLYRREEVKPQKAVALMYRTETKKDIVFDSHLFPMVSPPLPWISLKTGGYLLSGAQLVRMPYTAYLQKQRLEEASNQTLYPLFDSLNQLGAVPWRINKPILDLVIKIFNEKGDDSLGVRPHSSECPMIPPSGTAANFEAAREMEIQRAAIRKKKKEMHSLWCDMLYRLSLANHFRDRVFWLPHNMDFRGRVYPCPPHLNHLGDDVSRAIMMFAKGEPLGEKGLEWLKLHLINLTGLKKRETILERLKFADEIMPEILDSADQPLSGHKWWMKSEEPWQTLSCCMEIANAVRSPDPQKYVSHFPIHQDGSCNGLQHYAALGRDVVGAQSVNLMPSETPQDVYSTVAELVEKKRQEDESRGVAIAAILNGYIKRKVIKQTVMTTVYGVTWYGARLQIKRQLADIPEFPKAHLGHASTYLVKNTFESLQQMFVSAKKIQDWLTNCARQIAKFRSESVEWVTPLGLPVVQPYHNVKGTVSLSKYDLQIVPKMIIDTYQRPHVVKHKNAFPPNFVHSLDASHMMLTSLFCERAGITYVSVHDCYWTHPSTVEIMNKICREQFVTLHSQPVLEDLSNFLYQKFSYPLPDPAIDLDATDKVKATVNYTLLAVPGKGDFKLKDVLDSVYFFS